MIGSGATFERQNIKRYLDNKLQAAKQAAEEDSSGEEEQQSSCVSCPITFLSVDPDIIIANKRIAAAAQQFIDENPWARDFNPN